MRNLTLKELVVSTVVADGTLDKPLTDAQRSTLREAAAVRHGPYPGDEQIRETAFAVAYVGPHHKHVHLRARMEPRTSGVD